MPDAPDKQRDMTSKPIVTLLAELTNDVRQWAEAELSLARAELDDLRRRLMMVAIFAGVAVVMSVTALIVLVQAGVAALAVYFGSEAIAGLVVGVALLVLAGLCVIIIRRNMSWKADSILFRWLAGSRRNGRGNG